MENDRILTEDPKEGSPEVWDHREESPSREFLRLLNELRALEARIALLEKRAGGEGQ